MKYVLFFSYKFFLRLSNYIYLYIYVCVRVCVCVCVCVCVFSSKFYSYQESMG